MFSYIKFGISISVISWMVGILLNPVLVKTKYFEKLSNMNFIESRAWNKRIGINQFRWIVKHTFFKFLNQKIKVKNRKTDLTEIRREMTLAETSHLIGFVFVLVFAIYWSIVGSLLYGLIILFFNILMNLYPALLQQENKRRIDKLISRRQHNVTHKG